MSLTAARWRGVVFGPHPDGAHAPALDDRHERESSHEPPLHSPAAAGSGRSPDARHRGSSAQADAFSRTHASASPELARTAVGRPIQLRVRCSSIRSHPRRNRQCGPPHHPPLLASLQQIVRTLSVGGVDVNVPGSRRSPRWSQSIASTVRMGGHARRSRPLIGFASSAAT
jgi:hypothetical protein